MRRLDVSTKKYPGLIALVSDEDFGTLNQWKWTASPRGDDKGFYAVSNRTGGDSRLMHKQILLAPMIDHIDGNGLNNTRENLRPCGGNSNQWNRRKGLNTSSRYKGVHWNPIRGCWGAQIMLDRVGIKIGSFVDEAAAALAYNLVAQQLYGSFACLNNDLKVSPAEMWAARKIWRGTRRTTEEGRFVEGILEAARVR